MASDVLQNRGSEIEGTRLTVYNLLAHFLDPTATEAFICRLYELTPEQVAAARAYVLNNPETVLARHLELEARSAAGNPPEVIDRAKQTHATFQSFKTWLVNRQRDEAQEIAARPASGTGSNEAGRLPTFREWLAEREARPEKGA